MISRSRHSTLRATLVSACIALLVSTSAWAWYSFSFWASGGGGSGSAFQVFWTVRPFEDQPSVGSPVAVLCWRTFQYGSNPYYPDPCSLNQVTINQAGSAPGTLKSYAPPVCGAGDYQDYVFLLKQRYVSSSPYNWESKTLVPCDRR
jgi:hypothetical protein